MSTTQSETRHQQYIPERVTVAFLKKLWACQDQVNLFASKYPDGVDLTVELLDRAESEGFSPVWFANKILKHVKEAECCWCSHSGSLTYLRQLLREREEALRACQAGLETKHSKPG